VPFAPGQGGATRLIVGLGNPGPQYRNTRHNVGFMVVDRLAEILGVAFSREKFGGLIAETRRDRMPIMLLKPLTFMNRSGAAVAQACRNRVTDPQRLLVVVDDVDLPTGAVRLRAKGGPGGHNGLKSIIEHMGSRDFPRLRIGIGKENAPGERVDHVLGAFHPEERPLVDEAVEQAARACISFIEEGIELTMSRFNTGSAGAPKSDRSHAPEEKP